jgi:hypothetical protein
MDKEHEDELKQLNASTDYYKQQLKKPVWKIFFDDENSHDVAKRMINNNKKRIKEIESYYK